MSYSFSDDYVYQGYPINLFVVVPVSSIVSVIGTAWLGAVAVPVRSRVGLVQYYLIRLKDIRNFGRRSMECVVLGTRKARRITVNSCYFIHASVAIEDKQFFVIQQGLATFFKHKHGHLNNNGNEHNSVWLVDKLINSDGGYIILCFCTPVRFNLLFIPRRYRNGLSPFVRPSESPSVRPSVCACTFRVRSITFQPLEGISWNFSQMFSPSRQRAKPMF
jgi:hypothetical protein